jgi:hypothetical protein
MINLQLQKKIVFIVKKLLPDYRSKDCLGCVDAAAAHSWVYEDLLTIIDKSFVFRLKHYICFGLIWWLQVNLHKLLKNHI